MSDNSERDVPLHSPLSTDRVRFMAVVDAVEQGVLIIDAAGVIQSANHEAIRLFGSESTIVGAHIAALLVAGETERVARPLLGSHWQTEVMTQRRWRATNACLRPEGRPTFTADCEIVPFHIDGSIMNTATSPTAPVTTQADADTSLSASEPQRMRHAVVLVTDVSAREGER